MKRKSASQSSQERQSFSINEEHSFSQPQNNKKAEKSQLTFFIHNPEMIKVLNAKGIQSFFPIQYQTFQHIYKGMDIIARDRTGSGKTLAFSLPIIQRFRAQKVFGKSKQPKFLIVLPTRQLAIQVKNQIQSLRLKGDEDFNVIPVYGGSDINQQIRKIRIGVDIIVSTPGRLIDLLERNVISLSKLQVTCLDEADEMMKQGFQPDIEKIFSFISKNSVRKTQNLLFSATIPQWVTDLSKKYLSSDKIFIDLIKDSDNKTSKTVQHLALNAPSSQRNSMISDLVNLYGGRHGRTIIFCERKKQVNEIVLNGNLSIESQPLHGDIPQKQRQVTFQAFKQGKVKCIVATNVAARGLDIPEVDLILQLEPPAQIDSYIHRAGRTGRAGKSGVCITFYNNQQESILERIERLAHMKFKKIGPPQPNDIIQGSTKDIILSLKKVSDLAIEPFYEIAEQMISEEGAVKSLAKALAFISGNTEKITERSFLCSIEGYATYMVKSPSELRTSRIVLDFLRKESSENLANSVKGLKKLNDKTIVFDIPETHKPEMQELVEKNNERKNELNIIKVTSMGMLEENQMEAETMVDEIDEKEIRQALKNKKELEIFIGSLPSNASESEVIQFFKGKGVKLAKVNLPKTPKGDSKGIGFGLCLNKDNLEKALKLNGCKFGTRSLKIDKAS